MEYEQSCKICTKQSTCPKVARIENYILDGCSEFSGYGTVVTEEYDDEEDLK